MADSNITKKALAGALKELMDTKPFQKISVSDICERCQMNRKSFYYHFKDKYDLMNWIYDTEFIGVAKITSRDGSLPRTSANIFMSTATSTARRCASTSRTVFPSIFGELRLSSYIMIWGNFLERMTTFPFMSIFMPMRWFVPSSAGWWTRTVCRQASLCG